MQLYNIETFDKYQEGTLSKREKQDFETQLSADEATQNAYQSYLTMVEGIRLAERKRLKEELLNSSPIEAKVNKRKLIGYWSKMAIAASLVLVAGFSVYYCSTSNERIYAHFELGRGDNTMNIEANEENSRTIFDEAIRWRDNQDFDKALDAFSKIEESDINLYFIAQYNMALLYTKNGEKTQARVILTKLINHPEKHFSKEKAATMLKALDKPCFFW
jgi:tetratricopeptide (TPR) repeat protein